MLIHLTEKQKRCGFMAVLVALEGKFERKNQKKVK